jgi:hypothetical protein
VTTTLSPELELIGHDLEVAFRRLIVRRQRRRRTLRIIGATVTLAAIFSAAAVASGIGPDLQLDPTKWTIFHRGEVDGGKAAYVHATENASGRHSLFIVEHDADLDRYQAFLLHERIVDAGNAAEAESDVRTRTEPGTLCTPEQLTRAEVVALQTLRASFAPGTNANATKERVDNAVRESFGATRCRGLEYATEQARFVFAGIQPESMLMAGAR